MKVLLISSKDYGGAGKGALMTHRALKSIGVESKLLVLRRHSSDQDVVQFPESKNVFRRFWDKVRNRLIYLEHSAYQNTNTTLAACGLRKENTKKP